MTSLASVTRPAQTALLLAAGMLLAHQAVAAEKTPEAPKLEIELQEDVQYGTGAGEPLTMHLAKPKGLSAPAPCVVFIHGGGWMFGDKKMHLPEIKAAAADGFVSATIGYRFAPKHRFPAQVEDAKCAIRYLRAHATEIGLDPQKIAAVGFSAGAHLSMMLGVMDSSDGLEGEGGCADQSSKVQCVVSFFGPTNLTNTDINSTVARDILDEKSIRNILENFVGGKPEEHLDTLKTASPLTYVNAGDAPILMFQGTKDNLVPYDQAFEMATALSKAGIPGRVELMLGHRHGWAGDELTRTRKVSYDFIREQFNGKKRTAGEKKTAAPAKDPA